MGEIFLREISSLLSGIWIHEDQFIWKNCFGAQSQEPLFLSFCFHFTHLVNFCFHFTHLLQTGYCYKLGIILGHLATSVKLNTSRGSQVTSNGRHFGVQGINVLQMTCMI